MPRLLAAPRSAESVRGDSIGTDVFIAIAVETVAMLQIVESECVRHVDRSFRETANLLRVLVMTHGGLSTIRDTTRHLQRSKPEHGL